MTVCAYCDDDKRPLTKEHILPAALMRASPGRETFSAKSQSIFGGEPTVKDTCVRCNNEALSQLDAVAVRALLTHRDSWHREADKVIDLDLDGATLARWLLKVCFNMARVTKADDLTALRAQRHFILNGGNVSPGLYLFGGIVRSRRLTAEEQQAHGFPSEWLDPEFLRITLWRDPAVLKSLSISRAVFIDALGFIIVKVRKAARLEPVHALIRRKMGFRRLSTSSASPLQLGSSLIDSETSNEVSFLANAEVYQKHFARKRIRQQP